MEKFKGLTEGKLRMTPVPEVFFRQLLLQIDNLNELKLTAYVFWRLDQVEGAFRFLRHSDLTQDHALLQGLDGDPQAALEALDQALERCVQRGVLLYAALAGQDGPEEYYFVNSPKGRAAVRAIQSGQWRPGEAGSTGAPTSEPPPEMPNIFRLYEENVGPLTPLMAETLGEAEDTYPPEWIVEAIEIAVKNNKRTWRYIGAILERWQREGKHDRKEQKQDRSDPAQAGRKYVEGDYAEYVEH